MASGVYWGRQRSKYGVGAARGPCMAAMSWSVGCCWLVQQRPRGTGVPDMMSDRPAMSSGSPRRGPNIPPAKLGSSSGGIPTRPGGPGHSVPPYLRVASWCILWCYPACVAGAGGSVLAGSMKPCRPRPGAPCMWGVSVLEQQAALPPPTVPAFCTDLRLC
jgi:hypothetical protein